MREEKTNRGVPDGGRRQDLLVAVLISLPLWACMGIAAIVLFYEDQMTEVAAAVLIAAAALEIILLRRYWRDAPSLLRAQVSPLAAAAVLPAPRRFRLRQALLLLGLTVTFLHYYYWEVQTQIASLPSVTVFVPTGRPSSQLPTSVDSRGRQVAEVVVPA